MESGTGFRWINSEEEDGMDCSGGDRLGLGFSRVQFCGTVTRRMNRIMMHRYRRMMAERCFSTQGQVGRRRLINACTRILQFSSGGRTLGTFSISSARAFLLFGDGRGLWRWFSSAASGTQWRGRDTTAVSFSSDNGDGNN